jgi:hypothetical protein
MNQLSNQLSSEKVEGIPVGTLFDIGRWVEQTSLAEIAKRIARAEARVEELQRTLQVIADLGEPERIGHELFSLWQIRVTAWRQARAVLQSMHDE